MIFSLKNYANYVSTLYEWQRRAEKAKRKHDLNCIIHVLKTGTCHGISCDTLEGTPHQFGCPLKREHCSVRITEKDITDWMEENNVTKGDLFAHLFEGDNE